METTRDVTTHPSKLRVVIKPNAARDAEKLGHSYVSDGDAQWSSHCEHSLAIFLKIRNGILILLLQPSNYPYIPEK